MLRENLNDLVAFAAVARAGSFTRAAARSGVTQPVLSRAVRALEERLGVRLLARTTRAVVPTEAGERLLRIVGPQLDGIAADLSALAALRDKPAGTIRITSGEHAAASILWPALERLLPAYPDVTVDVITENALTDIVSERFDAGIRMGDQVEKDMVAVRIGPALRMAVVATPAYFAARPRPRTPQDLTAHACINLHLASYGGRYAWEFEKGGRELRVRVDGPLAFSSVFLARTAALAGLGVACMPDDLVRADIAAGRLVRVLADWCAPFAGYHLYYPSRRQASPAFAVLVDALRYPGVGKPAPSA